MHQSFILGLDIAKRIHYATLIDRSGKVLDSFKFANSKQGFHSLVSHLNKWVDNTAHLIVGLEATGHYWLNLYQFFADHAINVIVLNPLQTKSFRNTSIRGAKTDKIDSRQIADFIRFSDEPVSVAPAEDLIVLKQLTRFRSDLVNQIANTKKKLIALLDKVFPEFQELFSDIAGITSMALLEEYCLPEEIAKISTAKLTKFIQKTSRSRLGEAKAKLLKQQAEQSIGLTFGIDAFTLEMKILIEQIKHLEAQVKKVAKKILEVSKRQKTTLTTIPGISDTIAAVVIAELGNINKFAKAKDPAKAIAAYAGLDAKPKESGSSNGKRKMSKRGSRYLRTAIWQASFIAYQRDPMFQAIYQKHKEKGKHHNVAISHVARKMVNVIYSLLRSNAIYKPVMSS